MIKKIFHIIVLIDKDEDFTFLSQKRPLRCLAMVSVALIVFTCVWLLLHQDTTDADAKDIAAIQTLAICQDSVIEIQDKNLGLLISRIDSLIEAAGIGCVQQDLLMVVKNLAVSNERLAKSLYRRAIPDIKIVVLRDTILSEKTEINDTFKICP